MGLQLAAEKLRAEALASSTNSKEATITREVQGSMTWCHQHQARLGRASFHLADSEPADHKEPQGFLLSI